MSSFSIIHSSSMIFILLYTYSYSFYFYTQQLSQIISQQLSLIFTTSVYKLLFKTYFLFFTTFICSIFFNSKLLHFYFQKHVPFLTAHNFCDFHFSLLYRFNFFISIDRFNFNINNKIQVTNFFITNNFY